MRPLSFGEILDLGFQVFRNDYLLYVPLAIIGQMPLAIGFGLYELSAGNPVLSIVGGSLSFIGILIMFAAWPAVTFAIDERINDRTLSVGGAFRRGFRLLPRTIFFGILWYLLFLIAMLVSLIPGFVMVIGLAFLELPALVVGIVSTVAFVLPIVFVMGWVMGGTFVAIQVLTREDRGPYASLFRSFELSKGAYARIALIFVITWAIVLVPTFTIFLLSGVGQALMSGDPTGLMAPQPWSLRIGTVIVGGFTTPFMIACAVVTYYDRRVRLEGYDIEAAAEAL